MNAPDPDWGHRGAEGRTLLASLVPRVGPVDVGLQVADKTERPAAGEFRPLVCTLPGRNRDV